MLGVTDQGVKARRDNHGSKSSQTGEFTESDRSHATIMHCSTWSDNAVVHN